MGSSAKDTTGGPLRVLSSLPPKAGRFQAFLLPGQGWPCPPHLDAGLESPEPPLSAAPLPPSVWFEVLNHSQLVISPFFR